MNINYAFVQAFERSKAPEKKGSSSRAFSLLLLTVFFVVLMGGLGAGAHIYSKVVEVQAHTNAVHLQAGLMANTVHVNDSVFAIEQDEGPEGPALVLVEALDMDAYETRIYTYEGMLYQEYAIPGHDYNPKNATPLFKTDTFEFEYSGKMLSITTDLGTLDVALRSSQGSSL